MATAAKIGIGSAINRVDGVEKVTGTARYAAEHPVENLLYGYIVEAAIAKGRIVSIDEEAARAVPGVVEVITHLNRPHVAWTDHSYQDELKIPGSPFRPLYDDRIQFSQQPIALVMAETFEAARYAASLIKVAYEAEAHNTDFEVAVGDKYVPKKKRSGYMAPKNRGDAVKAFADAPLKVSGDYRLAPEHHNPMEMFASTVEWHDDGSITVHDKTQGSQVVQAYLSSVFGFSKKKVRVLNPYVGGGFGSGLRPQHQVFLAVLAAKMLERSVRVTMTRNQMFSHAYRPQAIQSIALGAETTGKLTAIRNEATTSTSRYEDNMENVVTWGLMNYDCPNADAEYTVAQVDTATSADMRAPGAATGMTLFEMAIDEMAYAAKVDPLEFRRVNYSAVDAMNSTPYTSKALREAFDEGAAAFGWAERTPEPRSMRDGTELIGWGCATGMWDAQFAKTAASAKLSANGALEVACATSDIGTGTYTVMTLVAADTLGLPPE